MTHKEHNKETLTKAVLLEDLSTRVAILEAMLGVKKNKSHKESREKVLDFTDDYGSITFRGAKQMGLIPKDMNGDTFRKCVLKDDFVVEEIKKGCPVIYHRRLWYGD